MTKKGTILRNKTKVLKFITRLRQKMRILKENMDKNFQYVKIEYG